MSDKEINDLLNKINDSHGGNGYLLDLRINSNSGKDKKAKLLKDVLDISYLESDLKLVIRFFDMQDAQSNIIKLSRKGLKVIKKGGWI